jgi:hypothetical protein
MLQIRAFSRSAALFMLPSHPLFPSIDWDRIEAGQYAVVDPVNTGTILYVSYQDYLVLVRVAMSNNVTLKVLAAPGEAKPSTSTDPVHVTDPSDPSKKTPAHELLPTDLDLLEFFFPKTEQKVNRVRRTKALRTLLQSPLLRFVEGSTSAIGSLMIKLTDGNILEWLTMWHERLHWWSRATVPGTISRTEVNTFGHFLRHILRHNGINHVIQRLKIMLFVVNAYLGGRKLTTTQGLGFRIRLSNGLPAALPRRVRDGIRHGNMKYIRIWASILNSYKGILGTWKEPCLEKSSITQEAPLLETSDLKAFGVFCRLLWRNLKRLPNYKRLSFHVRSPFFTTKAGPNSPSSLLGAGLDAYLWYSLDRFNRTELERVLTASEMKRLTDIRKYIGVDQNLIREWCKATGQPSIERMIRMTAKMFHLQFTLHHTISSSWKKFLSKAWAHPQVKIGRADKMSALTRKIRRALKSTGEFWDGILGANNAYLRFKAPTLSRLHNLYEAAGKVRTIAIVDYWTNFVLKPLHDWMFDILTLLPQDATFDQEGRVEEFSRRGYTHVYSYDLKSATDLIPFSLYRFLFGWVFPRAILESWSRLLTDRRFLVPESTLETYPGHSPRIRYGTGQPMGALTSWASMALLHHALVLFSAFTVGKTTVWTILDFVDYLVLGDDIVIADEEVAQAYINLMKRLHIPIGLAKSHISEIGMFNFANQTFVDAINVSPISMKEDLNAKGLLARIALAMRMARRGWRDMESRKWLSHLLRMLVVPTIWKNSIAPLAAARRTIPFLHWIVSSALLPGTSRFGYTGLRIDPKLLLSTYVRQERVWTSTLRELGSIALSVTEQSLLSLFIAKWVDSIYQQFLDNRKRLLDFDSWLTRVISVDLEWLFRLIFEEGRKEANDRWAAKYRVPLKEVQVSTKIPAVNTVGLLEIATGRSLDEIFDLLAKAEAEIPLIPDFSDKSLATLFPKDQEGVPSRDIEIRRAELQAMLRVASLMVMLEAIPRNSADSGARQMSGHQNPADTLERLLKATQDQQRKSK